MCDDISEMKCSLQKMLAGPPQQPNVYEFPSRREKHRFVVVPHIHESKDQP